MCGVDATCLQQLPVSLLRYGFQLLVSGVVCYNYVITLFEMACSWARTSVLQAVSAGVALIVLSLCD
jgi:hypothetical protein